MNNIQSGLDTDSDINFAVRYMMALSSNSNDKECPSAALTCTAELTSKAKWAIGPADRAIMVLHHHYISNVTDSAHISFEQLLFWDAS